MSHNTFCVVKRNGTKEEVSFDKVTRRIKKLCTGLSTDVNPIMIAQKVCSQIYDNVSTVELDELAAQICISMETTHLDYGVLASRIIISNNHKCTSPSFSETIYLLYRNNISQLIADDVYEIIMKNKDKLNAVINYEKDYLFDYFGFKTLEKAYLMKVGGKIIERIQHLFMRVSVGIHKTDLKSVIQSYELMSNKYFTHATPSLYNAGTPRPQFASCFAGDTLVSTLSGPRCIKDVMLGDEVITHLGNVKKVIQKHKNEINGRKLYKVHISQTNDFIVTEDHKLYTQNGWKEVCHLNDTDYIMIPKYNGEITNVNKTYMTFLGIWYSSGQILYNKNIYGIAVIISNDNKKLLDCCNSIKEYFDINNLIIEQLSKPNMIKISYESVKIGEMFNNLYGSDLPREFYKYDTSLINDFIYGLTKTNGYLSKTTNKNLMQQIYALCRLHNMTVNMNINESLQNDSLTGDDGFKYLRFIKKEEVSPEILDDNYVYTLGVEDDHSYSIEGIIAQNCFLMGMEDSVKGIYKAVSDIAEISACAGGIGVSLSKIRSKNSYIKGLNGVSNGIVPLCRVLNETARHINQAGKRPGSIAVYIEPHNVEILEFLDLRKNTGSESERARDLFLALWISDLFMKRVETNSDWSLFDSNECKELDNTYGDEFEKLYLQYESKGMARKVIPARKVWNSILTSQIETGTPYISFKDNVNKKSNQSNIGVIKNSNLCNEIVQYSDHKEYAVCTLASISLPNFVVDGKFDFDKLIEVTNIVVRNLNKIIDVNFYPVPETELSNKKHRPMGVGVQGLADVYAKLGFPFDSVDAKELNKQIFETLYYGALVASHSLALETEPYETFQGSPMSKGLFQFDLWNIKPSNRHDWATLRTNIMQDGIANSLLIALMPTASTSQILGNNECFEPITSNIYSRRTIAGDFIVINKYLVKDLMAIGLWDANMKNNIIAQNGSVQNIDSIPKNIKDLYKTVWEIKQKVLIDQAIDRGPFVCQTQSMNLFFEEPTQSTLTSAFFHGWKNGLKTGSYYIRTKPKAQAQQFTVAPCEMCSA